MQEYLCERPSDVWNTTTNNYLCEEGVVFLRKDDDVYFHLARESIIALYEGESEVLLLALTEKGSVYDLLYFDLTDRWMYRKESDYGLDVFRKK